MCERQHGIPISVPDIWPPRKEISVKNKAIVAKTHRERKKPWQKIGDGGRPIEEETSPLLPQKLDLVHFFLPPPPKKNIGGTIKKVRDGEERRKWEVNVSPSSGERRAD